MSSQHRGRVSVILEALTERQRVERITFVAVALIGCILCADTFFSDGIINWQGTWVGGDFFAFHTAGTMVLNGDALQAWDAAAFEAALQEKQSSDFYGLTWQYPPAMYFMVTPLGLLPYKLGYWIWMLVGLAFLALVLRALEVNRQYWFILLGSSIVLVTLIQGQNSLFFGGLLMLALAVPDKRPVIAGIAAGLLTLKPHLGVLIPIAYIAGGYWRSFGVAALVSVLLAGAATLVFGVDSWVAFYESLQRVENDLTSEGGLYPYARMISLFSALASVGVPYGFAMGAHLILVAVLGGLVIWTWRTSLPLDMKAAIVIPACLLCSPYAYYYEMIALLFPVIVLARYGLTTWSRGLLVVAWPLVLYLPSIQPAIPLQIGFVLTISLLGLLALLAVEKSRSAQSESKLGYHGT